MKKQREKKVSKAFEEKQRIVAEIQKNLEDAKSCVWVDYKTLTVAEATELRVKSRSANCKYKVYKNNLVRIALNNLGINGLDEKLTGSLAMMFSNADEISGVKLIAGQKYKGKMAFQFGLIGNDILSAADVGKLRDMPTKDQLIAQLMGLLQSGARNIASVVNAIPRNLAVVVNERAKQLSA